MSTARNYMMCLVMAIFGQSCVDPISFETDPEESQLVFFGNFTQLNESHMFNISQTSDFGKPAIPVSGASIVIKDDQGNCADYQEIDPGIYELTADKMPGISGRAYHIEITLMNGKTYFTVPQVMPEPIEIDDIYYQIETRQVLSNSGVLVDQTFIDVFVDTPLQNSSGGSSHLRWTVDEIYSFVDRSCGPFDNADACYFLDPADESEVLLFSNVEGAQDNLIGLNVRSRLLVPFDEFTARHYFIVRQYTISEEELDYWNKIDVVANQSGNLFDLQPAKVPGNIFEMDNQQASVLGYFGVNGQTMARTFTTPFTIRPHPVFTCQDDSFFANHLPECCVCSAKPGNQIERPAFWDED